MITSMKDIDNRKFSCSQANSLRFECGIVLVFVWLYTNDMQIQTKQPQNMTKEIYFALARTSAMTKER